MIRRPPRSTLFPYTTPSDLRLTSDKQLWRTVLQPLVAIEEVSVVDLATVVAEVEAAAVVEVVVVAVEDAARRRRTGFP